MAPRFFFGLVACLGLGCGGDEALVIGPGPGGTAGATGGAAGEPAAGAGSGGASGDGGTGTSGTGGTPVDGPESDVISVDEGDFNVGSPPASTGTEALPQIVSLTGPAAVTNGGAAILHVELSPAVADPLFLVSLDGDSGYHRVTGTDPDGDGVYDIRVQVAGEATQTSLVLRVALQDAMGNVGAYAELAIELVQSGTGDVKITLSFDRLHDLDLHVIEPNGEEISFANPSSATGGELDLDSGAHCMASPGTSENIFWPPGGAPQGEYRVSVQNFEECTPGPIEFSVRVAYDNQVNTYRGTFAAGTAGTGEDDGGEVQQVTTFRRGP